MLGQTIGTQELESELAAGSLSMMGMGMDGPQRIPAACANCHPACLSKCHTRAFTFCCLSFLRKRSPIAPLVVDFSGLDGHSSFWGREDAAILSQGDSAE